MLILSLLLISCHSVTAFATGSDWVPNWTNDPLPNTYYYNGEWHKNPPSKAGVEYTYNGQTYISSGTSQKAQPAQSQPAQSTCQAQPTQQVARPYYYDNAWHTNAPTSGSKQYWYNGVWYTTAPAQATPSPSTHRPSAYVDNTANAKAQDLVNYAYNNGVIGSYSDTTDSDVVAQKCVSFSGAHGNFDMTLTTHVGSDGNYVTKYWRAGIERTLSEIQSMILGCK